KFASLGAFVAALLFFARRAGQSRTFFGQWTVGSRTARPDGHRQYQSIWISPTVESTVYPLPDLTTLSSKRRSVGGFWVCPISAESVNITPTGPQNFVTPFATFT